MSLPKRFNFFSRAASALLTLAVSASLVFAASSLATSTAAVAKTQTAQQKAQAKRVAASKKAQKSQWVRAKSGKRVVAKGKNRKSRMAVIVPAKPTFGQLAGLHNMQDDLALKSSVAFVVDQDTNEVLFRKNDAAVLPIASLTKLMTGVIISEAKLSLSDIVTITEADIDTEKGSRSRLQVGTSLSRGELMHLALMSSENRAAHALGRSYPGGMNAFVAAMNAKATSLGMRDTTYVEPTGLSSKNQSSGRDLATLVAAASKDPALREWSTSQGAQVPVGNRVIEYRNTNRLTANPNWDIGLQKTGFISEAGQCLVMQTQVAGRKLIMVFLDSVGKYSRLGDAERVRSWLETSPAAIKNGAQPVAQQPRG